MNATSPSRSPLVSIGLPVYNGGESFAQAVESLLAQTYDPIELIISDNASTDGTSERCEAFARGDSRVRYVRHNLNRGAGENFSHVLRLANGPYFMFAAHDDRWRPRFVEANARVLETQPDVVLSVSRVELLPAQARRPMNPGTFPLMGTVRENVTNYLRRPGYNSRFYGLMRTDAIREAYAGVPHDLYGGDWLIMVRLLEHGKMFELDEVLFERSIPSHSPQTIRKFFRKVLGTNTPPCFPLARFSREALRLPHVPRSLANFCSLAFYNVALLPFTLRAKWSRA